jgi:hypothetical protein
LTRTFRIATRDELWLRGRLVESRLSHGEAIEDERGIIASDARDDALVAACEREMDRMHAVMPRDARVRLVATASTEEAHAEEASTMTIGMRGLSVVTSPEHAREDYELLRAIAAVDPEGEPLDYRGVPIVWRNGSAAVLLHEAIGHAKEHDHAPIDWPPWLEVDLPLKPRRASFSDVPLLRMTNLRARSAGVPPAGRAPSRRLEGGETPPDQPPRTAAFPIEILLVAAGSYEPLTETVTLRIAAANYNGRRLPPFDIREPRAAVAQALIAAEGEPIRYPGVVCSREGQELVVGSFAPVMVTHFR